MVPGQVFGGWRQLGQRRENDGSERGCSRKWQPGEGPAAVTANVAGATQQQHGVVAIPTPIFPQEQP